jgi:hypothetical protein
LRSLAIPGLPFRITQRTAFQQRSRILRRRPFRPENPARTVSSLFNACFVLFVSNASFFPAAYRDVIFTGAPVGLGATLIVAGLILRRASPWGRPEQAPSLISAAHD